ncbi:hypothetical protein L798_04778 [Zootermopsis nevadensis]|uniref:Uncharacterized protein n=1 Tax=Zootermopsis nevadensis TaxID=136037 RepID=A0A067RCA7_ZOONE|nr:hypothetical protein L798_04778 [Zootermopsis nevadensis]
MCTNTRFAPLPAMYFLSKKFQPCPLKLSERLTRKAAFEKFGRFPPHLVCVGPQGRGEGNLEASPVSDWTVQSVTASDPARFWVCWCYGTNICRLFDRYYP